MTTDEPDTGRTESSGPGGGESESQSNEEVSATKIAKKAKHLAEKASKELARRTGRGSSKDGPEEVPPPKPRTEVGPGECPKCGEQGLHPMELRPGYMCVECDKKYSPQMLRVAKVGY